MKTINYCTQQLNNFAFLNHSLLTRDFNNANVTQTVTQMVRICAELLQLTNKLPNKHLQTSLAPVPDLPPRWVEIRCPPVCTKGKRLSGKQRTVKAASDSSSWELLAGFFFCSFDRWGKWTLVCHSLFPTVNRSDAMHLTAPSHTLCNSANTPQLLHF